MIYFIIIYFSLGLLSVVLTGLVDYIRNPKFLENEEMSGVCIGIFIILLGGPTFLTYMLLDLGYQCIKTRKK